MLILAAIFLSVTFMFGCCHLRAKCNYDDGELGECGVEVTCQKSNNNDTKTSENNGN